MKTLLALVLPLALALPASAAVDLEAAGLATSGASSASLANGGVYASGDRSTPQLEAVSGGTVNQGLTAGRVNAEARINNDYTVSGLAAGTPVTFHWLATSSLVTGVDNANIGTGFDVYIFERGGPAYIHTVGWSISYVDGPAFMGDFAGIASSPIRDLGHAGSPGSYSFNAPASNWAGYGSIGFTTTWTMHDASWGHLRMGTYVSMSASATGALGLELVGLSVPNSSYFLNGVGASMTLDNGTVIAISAVPEPAPALLMVAGLLAILRRRLYSNG
jgi:hypothetical protein